MPDLVDMTHLRDAAYVDWFVSNDASLLEVARNAHLDIETMTISDLADRLDVLYAAGTT